MDDQNDDVIKQMRVREVAGVFHLRTHLENAVDALLTHGFDRADISLVEGRDEIRARFGGLDIPAEDSADIPAAPGELSSSARISVSPWSILRPGRLRWRNRGRVVHARP